MLASGPGIARTYGPERLGEARPAPWRLALEALIDSLVGEARLNAVGLTFFLDEDKDMHWIGVIERPFSGLSRVSGLAIARGVASNPDAYVYLAESIRAWPDQRSLAARIAEAGPWSRIGWRNLTGGVVALHRATKV